MNTRTRLLSLGASVVLAGSALVACGDSDSLEGGSDGGDSSTIVVGSQDYYSNEIIAEIYAQALEQAGYDVQRDFRIGQREVYMGEIENGSIDLFPEYSGPLLQYWEPDADGRLTDDVYSELVDAAPDTLTILDQAPATDQDAYVITREFAEENGITSIEDLANVDTPLTLGANSEAESRPNGPQGLASAYGIEADFTPIEDGGGPLTVNALQDGTIQLAIIYTADPTIEANDLVVLEDPAGLFLASHVVPVASDAVDQQAHDIINAVSAALTSEELLALNARSVDEQAAPATIATEWLEENPVDA